MDDDPVEISGRIRRRSGIDIDETAAFQIYFSRGAVAQCLVTQAASTFFFTIDVHGRAGRLTLRGRDFSHFEIEVSSTVDAAFAEPTVVGPRAQGDHISTMLVPELEEFAAAILEPREPSVSATDGHRVLRVLDAVVAADRSGAPVGTG
jgi:predicted dehydrogenase